MHNTFHAQLSLPVVFDATLIDADTSPVPYRLDPDTPIVKWLASLGIEIVRAGAEQFYIAPYKSIPIHIDGATSDHKVKLNFQYQGQGSVMRWYHPVDANISKSKVPGEFGQYVVVPKDQVTTVWTAEIGQPSLVNTGVLHNVENGPNPRWVISIPLWDVAAGKNLQWEDALIKFDSWLL
jgi:hypothetical protein